MYGEEMKSLFETLTDKAKTMSDSEIIKEYDWINPDHVKHMLKEIRHYKDGG